MRGLNFFPKSASRKILHNKCRITVFLLSLLFLLWPGPVWAISADDLLKLLIEENVITPEKAEKIKEKARQLDRAKKAREEARKAQEAKKIKREVKAEARAEAETTVEKEVKKAAGKFPKPKLDFGYKKGFYVQTRDGKFKTRLRIGLMARYVNLSRDKDVIPNSTNTSYFQLRRARLIFDGNMFTRDIKYLLQLQMEPQSDVNLLDAQVWFARWKFFQPWVGRGKIPYTLSFWQSGFQMNFIERSIFEGESDVDWPGGNADLDTSTDFSNNLFNQGGFNLGRSQGVMIKGDLDLWAPRNIRYWGGIWNGPNTGGNFANNDAELCYTGRVLFAPLPSGGPDAAELKTQGDYKFRKGWPLFFVMGAGYTNRGRNTSSRPGTDTSETFNTSSHGFDLAACFKFYGFALQGEWARETFIEKRPNTFIPGQFGTGRRTAHREGWYLAASQFLWPQRLELVFRYAYVNRVKNPNTPYVWSYLASNDDQTNFLVPVRTNGGINPVAREGIDREITTGVNFYVNGHNHKYQFDYSWLMRSLYGGNNQEDHRFRFQGVWRF